MAIKMKFKTTKKDWYRFFILMVVILYVVAFAVANIAMFEEYASFDHFTLIPLIAFDPRYLVGTIIIYILTMIFVVTSIDKSIFKRDKGFGFKSEEKSQGNYSRRATTDTSRRIWRSNLRQDHYRSLFGKVERVRIR